MSRVISNLHVNQILIGDIMVLIPGGNLYYMALSMLSSDWSKFVYNPVYGKKR